MTKQRSIEKKKTQFGVAVLFFFFLGGGEVGVSLKTTSQGLKRTKKKKE